MAATGEDQLPQLPAEDSSQLLQLPMSEDGYLGEDKNLPFEKTQGLWIRIDFNPNPDPAYFSKIRIRIHKRT
jgi:hypothetical protein